MNAFLKQAIAAAALILTLAGCNAESTTPQTSESDFRSGDGSLGGTGGFAEGRYVTTARVYRMDDHTEVGRSVIVRSPRGVSTHISTSGLVPDHAVTIWLVIFNRPENCTGPCDVEDLADVRTEPDAMWAGGAIVPSTERVTVPGFVRTGDTEGSTNPPFGLPPIGLTNPFGAELHLVIKTHGPVIRSLEWEMTHTLAAGCNDAPPGFGTPGPNACAEIQFSEHKPAARR